MRTLGRDDVDVDVDVDVAWGWTEVYAYGLDGGWPAGVKRLRPRLVFQ